MKKFLALLLCLATVTAFLTSCPASTGDEDEDKGAIVNMYLCSEIRCFDPLYAYTNALSNEYDSSSKTFVNKLYTDADAVKLLGLLYEGLTKINDSGKVEMCLAKGYTISENTEENIYKMQITLKSTKWSDGVKVQADDFVYTVKRVLDYGTSCEGASLLFDIKNARAVKNGDISVDQLGITAPDTDTIEIQFEGKIDYNQFLENLASPLLVPLREDKVSKPLTDEETTDVIYDADGMPATDKNWCTTATSLVCSGPFFIRTLSDERGGLLVLERNKYYFLDSEKNEKVTKYVTPYKIEVHYNWTFDDVVAAYNAGTLFYVGKMTNEQYAEHAGQLKETDMFSTGCYVFNTSSELMQNSSVRKALSLALDRNTVASYYGIDKPATGIVPLPVYDTKYGTTYRSTYGDILSTSANIEEAKSVLKTAGISGGNITILVRNYVTGGTDQLLAEHAKQQWEQLGFNVTIDVRGVNMFQTKLSEGAYNVVYTDWNANTVRAFSVLAPFSVNFSGTKIDLQHYNYDPQPNTTGYSSTEYDALIEQAYALAEGSKERNDILFEAEKMLMDDMPLIPLVFHRSGTLTSNKLSGIKYSVYGYMYLQKMKLKNYQDYINNETEAK